MGWIPPAVLNRVRTLVVAVLMLAAVSLCFPGCEAFGGPAGDGATELRQSVGDAEVRLVDLESKLDAARADAADARARAERALADASADAQRAADALARAQSAEETLAAQRAAAEAAAKERAAQQAVNQATAQAAENARAAASVAQVQKAVDAGKAALDAALRPDGSLDVAAGANALGPLLGPWGVVGASLIGLAYGVYERNQRNRDLRSVAVAIDRVSNQDTILSSNLNAAWPKIEEALTPKARAVINETSVT
jgi:hypothetical protein